MSPFSLLFGGLQVCPCLSVQVHMWFLGLESFPVCCFSLHSGGWTRAIFPRHKRLTKWDQQIKTISCILYQCYSLCNLYFQTYNNFGAIWPVLSWCTIEATLYQPKNIMACMIHKAFERES